MLIRRAEEPDITRLETFYHRFHPDRPRLHNMETWRWEFLGNPNAQGSVPFFVIETAGEIHGGIGYLPVRLQVGDQTMRAGHPVNHFVDPTYKGLPALRLMRTCLRDCPIAFFSYVSDDAARLANAVGFIDLSPHLMHYYLVLRADTNPGGWRNGARSFVLRIARNALVGAARVYASLASGRGEIAVSAQLPDSVDLPSNAGNRDGRFRVVKDAQYLRWRYARSPILNCSYVTIHDQGGVTAMAVVHLDRKDNQAVILDVICTSRRLSQLLRLLVAVIDHCRSAGATILSSSMIHPEMDRVLRLLGFGRTKSDYRFLVYAEDKILKQALADHRKWEFFLGDTDVY